MSYPWASKWGYKQTQSFVARHPFFGGRKKLMLPTSEMAGLRSTCTSLFQKRLSLACLGLQFVQLAILGTRCFWPKAIRKATENCSEKTLIQIEKWRDLPGSPASMPKAAASFAFKARMDLRQAVKSPKQIQFGMAHRVIIISYRIISIYSWRQNMGKQSQNHNSAWEGCVVEVHNCSRWPRWAASTARVPGAGNLLHCEVYWPKWADEGAKPFEGNHENETGDGDVNPCQNSEAKLQGLGSPIGAAFATTTMSWK